VDAVEIQDRVHGVERRACQSFTSSLTASVTLEMRGGDTSVPYISSRWLWISLTLRPRAYSEMILSSKPVQQV
jgi:hypothetical protein